MQNAPLCMQDTPKPTERAAHMTEAHERGYQLVHISFVRFFYGSAVSVAGVVNEHVHRSEPGCSLPHCFRELGAIGHIQRESER